MITPEIFEQQAKELAAMNTMQLAMPPDKGYMLASVVQAAAICLDFPETTQAFCKEFVNGFCDRYRDQMPMVVKAIEDTWENPNLVTEEEFEATLRDTPESMYDGFFGLVEDIYQDIETDAHKPHQGALCPINGKPCSKEGNFYYYPNDCPDWHICEEITGDNHDPEYDDDLEDRCAGGFTN